MTENSSEQASSADVRTGRSRFRLRIAVRSDVGRVRSENQDFAIASPETDRDHIHGHLMIVADGMGGHKGGATASRLAATTIEQEYLSSEGDDVSQALRTAIERANTRIHQEATVNEDLEGMGTTTSALIIRDDKAWIGHVGDSRIYRSRSGEIEQMTEDHSLVATMVREGLLTAEEAETHPRRNVLQRSMGVAAEVDVDVSGPLELQPGDRFILCSDGLHGLATSEEIAGIVKVDKDVDEAADELIRLALERGAHDNVTVIIAAVDLADGSKSDAAEDQIPATDPESGAEETNDVTASSSSSAGPAVGAGGCLLRSLLIGLSLLAIIGSFLLLVAGDLFVSWFSSSR